MNKGIPPSLIFLKKEITRLFRKKFASTPVIILEERDIESAARMKSLTDIVLVGSVVESLYLLRQKTGPSVRIWCLSHAHRKLVSGVFRIPESKIGCISRYELYPLKNFPIPFPETDQPITFVISGRWKLTKRIPDAIFLLNEIRKRWKGKVKIVYTSPYSRDSLIMKNFLIDAGIPDVVCHTLGKNWFQKINSEYKNPVLVSLSRDITEDFGMSLAIAEHMGWPCLLSQWGAHLDAKASFRIYIRNVSAEKEAVSLIRNWNKRVQMPEEYLIEETELPLPVNLSMLRKNLPKEILEELLFSKHPKSFNGDKIFSRILSGNQ